MQKDAKTYYETSLITPMQALIATLCPDFAKSLNNKERERKMTVCGTVATSLFLRFIQSKHGGEQELSALSGAFEARCLSKLEPIY